MKPRHTSEMVFNVSEREIIEVLLEQNGAKIEKVSVQKQNEQNSEYVLICIIYVFFDEFQPFVISFCLVDFCTLSVRLFNVRIKPSQTNKLSFKIACA